LVAPESTTQSVTGMGGANAIELRQPARGRVNECPIYCTGKPYWGAVKKACDVDQYGAKEDVQAGCTGKPY
jgi:sensor domain CHASE-containing protein